MRWSFLFARKGGIMKKQKRIIAVVLTATMVLATLGLTGCGKQESTMSMADEVSAFMECIDMEYAYDTTYNLAYNEDLKSSDQGFRTAGSDAEHKVGGHIFYGTNDLGQTPD